MFKRIILLFLTIVFFSLFGCVNNSITVKNNNPSGKDDLPSDINQPIIKVNHHLSKQKCEEGYYYGNKKAEEFINLLNRRDKTGIKNLFSKATQQKEDLDKEIDILFDYVSEQFIDYEEGATGTEKHTNGSIISYSLSLNFIGITDTKRYLMYIAFTKVDLEEPDDVGIDSFYIIDEEVNDALFEKQIYPVDWTTNAISCLTQYGEIKP